MSDNKEKTVIDGYLDQIDELLENASTVPFSNKKMVDADQLHELCDTIRINMPAEIKRAADTAREKKSIIADANKEAENVVAQAKQQADEIIRDAQARADQLVSQQEIIGRANAYAQAQAQRADEEAAAVINQAREKEKAIREAMIENINSSLQEAAAVLEKNLGAVNNAKEAINKLNQ